MKMKILQVNSVYNFGSTGKIVHDLHVELLSNNYDSIVCYGRGVNDCEGEGIFRLCSEFYSHINHLLNNISGIPYGGCHFATYKLKKIITKQKPDIVHLHCLNNYFINIYEIVKWLKKREVF